MKSYRSFEGEIPQGVEIIKEGTLVRLFFDFEKIDQEIDGEVIENLVCENVDVIGESYDQIVGAIICDKYDMNKREAIMSNYEDAKDANSDITEEKRTEYVNEYTLFQAYRKHAKEIAKEVVNKE